MPRPSPDQLTGGVIGALGFITLCISFTIGHVTWGGESSRLFPMIVSVLLIIFGVSLFLADTGAAPAGATPVESGVASNTRRADTLRVAGLMAVGVLYTASIGKLGYILPTAAAMPLVFWLFGVRSRVGLAVSAVLGPLLYYLMFFKALNVYPPYAPWLDVPFLS